MSGKYFYITGVLFFICLLSFPAFADKSSVSIDAPDTAEKGSEIIIKITVTHNGNNLFHHTDWVYIKVNGSEIARWDFKFNDLPENEVFTREVKYTVQGPLTIEAEANCNLHGSKGTAVKKVIVN